MKNPHKRKKRPKLVRQTLLNTASKIAVKEGIRSLTLDRVAEESGVSKGGLLHHFKNRMVLLEALADSILEDTEERILAVMDPNPKQKFRFTRAYLHVMTGYETTEDQFMIGMFSLIMVAEPLLRNKWTDWIETQLKYYASTDSGYASHVVRLAADGLWLSAICYPDNVLPERMAIINELEKILKE